MLGTDRCTAMQRFKKNKKQVVALERVKLLKHQLLQTVADAVGTLARLGKALKCLIFSSYSDL